MEKSSVDSENILKEDKPIKQWTKYSDKTRLKVVRTYLELGSLPKTAEKLNLDYNVLSYWKYKSTWWGPAIQRCQDERDRKLASRMEKVVELAVDKLEDRLINGESILDSKTGTVINVPMKARDLTVATKVLSERTDVLIGRVSKDTIAKELMQDKLVKLAKEFAAFTQSKYKIEEEPAITLEETEPGLYELNEDDDALHEKIS